MTGSASENGASSRAPLARTRRKGGYPSLFEYICIKAIYLFALIALYFALAKTYTEFLQPLYEYQHYRQNFVPTREVESMTVLSVAAALMPTSFRRPSDLLISLAIVFTLVPTMMMYTYADLGSETAFVTFAGLAVIFLAREIPITVPAAVSAWQGPGIVAIHLLSGLSLLGVATTVYQMGFDSFSLDLFDVYGRRAIAGSAVTGISAYIVGLGLQCNLLAIIMSFICRRWFMLVINLASSFLLFGLIGNKAPVIGAFVICILALIMQSRFVILIIVCCFSIVSVCFYLFFMKLEYLRFAATFHQRMLIEPVHLNDLYLHLFKDTKLYWGYSKVSLGLVDYPLSVDPQEAVAYYWLRSTKMHANTGFVGSGYMNAGLIGVLLYAVVIGLCCRLIDEFARQRGTQSFAAVICLPGFLLAVTTADLPTVLFSAGWSCAILVIAIFNPRTTATGRPGLTRLRAQVVQPSAPNRAWPG